MRALANSVAVVALGSLVVLAACEDDVGQQFGTNSASSTSSGASGSTSSGTATPGQPGGMPGGDDGGPTSVKFTVYVKDLILNETKRDNLSKPEAELLAPADSEDGSMFDAAFFSP